MMDIVLSILVLAGLALVGGALLAWRKNIPKKQIGLMPLLAVIVAVNVAIWTVPDDDGTAPIDQIEQ